MTDVVDARDGGSGRSVDLRRLRPLGIGIPVGLLGAWLTVGHRPGCCGPLTANPTTRFLVATALVILVCQLLGQIFTGLGQSAVVGEMLGGILLGPSALGALWPAAWHRTFAPDVLGHMQMAA